MDENSYTFSAAIQQFERKKQVKICGLHGGASALFLAQTVKHFQRTLCCIIPDDEELEPIAQDIALFTDTDVLCYPSFEIPPYTPLSPDPNTVAQRLSTLYRLLNNSDPIIILTSCEALLRRIIPKITLSNHCELIMRGEESDREQLINSLINSGYQMCSMVQQIGDFSVRGSIIDIFPPSADGLFARPFRLDFFGDTVESIRVFDPISQRSMEEKEDAVILPGSDILFPKDQISWKQCHEDYAGSQDINKQATERIIEQLQEHIRFAGIEFFLPLVYPQAASPQTLFDYLAHDSITVLYDPIAVEQRIKIVRDRISINYVDAMKDGAPLSPDSLFIQSDELESILKKFDSIELSMLPDPEREERCINIMTGAHSLIKQEIDIFGKKRGFLAPLAEKLSTWITENETVIISCRSKRQAMHFSEMLSHYGLLTEITTHPLDLDCLVSSGKIKLTLHPLSAGFDLIKERIHFLSTSELFGDRRLRSIRQKTSKGEDELPLGIEELSIGDIVVHRDHGIGVFSGLVNMLAAGMRGDFLVLEYQDNDKLYVPVDRLHLVNRYQGLTDQKPKIDRLGSEQWKNAKKKVTDAVWKIANELINIYAKRAIRKGIRFSPPGELFAELEQSFPFEETKGQIQAINEVLDDLTSDNPTDRLICGDVGYGKTEVAVRAAFKVIEDGYQVAVLVPTTVLAEQHAATFRDRYSALPVKVACINRFRTNKQQKELVRELAEGKIDLIVGTHRLLSKDIVFAKLGLLIIDEEHRFGVTHKEKIKKIKAEVDVIAMTATPIPRTLQMSLLGIRDLSVITTPPRHRRSVKTFLARYDNLVIREAIIREINRGGQLFFVHNRVHSIYNLAEKISTLVPQARIGVAHGQMPGRELENIMIKFINHDIDVLISTTIIESGLDIANANTIIINRADQLGLADIYQLRGRVGRSSKQSFSYLLVPALDLLTKDAKHRLRALMDCNELGGGFKLAMNDLQIRGGGNLLGVSQSGHIAAVGYDLYLELLQSTVEELKKNNSHDSSKLTAIDPEIRLKISAFLPDDYIKDPSQRYHFYRRLSLAGNSSPEHLEELYNELIDRYGSMPREANTLFRLIGLKYSLRKLGIEKLEQSPSSLVFTFTEESPVEPQMILKLINEKQKKKGEQIRFTPDHRLIIPIKENLDLFSSINTILNNLQP